MIIMASSSEYAIANLVNSGNGNFLMQYSDGNTITINIHNKSDNGHLNDLKKFLLSEIYRLKNEITQLSDNWVDNFPEENLIDNDDKEKELNIKKIVKAIINGNCVLFTGPEIAKVSKDEENSNIEITEDNSKPYSNLHKKFNNNLPEIAKVSKDEENDNIKITEDTSKPYNNLHERFNNTLSCEDIEFNDEDGFFMPGSCFTDDVQSYYSDKFHDENKLGNELIRKISLIPFNLIINYSPDDAISKIFNKNNVKNNFYWYNKQEMEISEEMIDWKKPLIYNALGLASDHGKYIYLHEDLDHYLKIEDNKRVPTKISTQVQRATCVIFLGFDFNKWYYRLLMFSFDFKSKLNESKRMIDEIGNTTSYHNKKFLEKQFGFYNLKQKDAYFICTLINFFKSSSLYKNKVLSELNNLDYKTRNSTLDKIGEILEELINIENRIIQWKM